MIWIVTLLGTLENPFVNSCFLHELWIISGRSLDPRHRRPHLKLEVYQKNAGRRNDATGMTPLNFVAQNLGCHHYLLWWAAICELCDGFFLWR
jgi:hypothetical protein